MQHPLAAFVPYAVFSVLHLVFIVTGHQTLPDIAATARMPLLALAAVIVLQGASRSLAGVLLLIAIVMSWFGGLSGSFAPAGLSLPLMLLFFGLAHLGSIWLYGKTLAGTAIASTRVNALVAWGGAFFLASDTFLSLVIYMPDAVAGWGFFLAMLTVQRRPGSAGARRGARHAGAPLIRRAPGATFPARRATTACCRRDGQACRSGPAAWPHGHCPE